MEFITFVRRPFTIEAIEITDENIEEIAKDVGELRHDEKGRPFIFVDSKKVPNVFNVHAGYWMTKFGKKTRVYSPKAFEEQFIQQTPELEALLKSIDDAASIEIPQPVQEVETTSV